MEKKKLFCWENDDYGQSLAFSFRSWVSLHHHTKLSSGLQRVFFLILILMSAPLIPLPIKIPTFIMTLCFWMWQFNIISWNRHWCRTKESKLFREVSSMIIHVLSIQLIPVTFTQLQFSIVNENITNLK